MICLIHVFMKWWPNITESNFFNTYRKMNVANNLATIVNGSLRKWYILVYLFELHTVLSSLSVYVFWYSWKCFIFNIKYLQNGSSVAQHDSTCFGNGKVYSCNWLCSLIDWHDVDRGHTLWTNISGDFFIHPWPSIKYKHYSLRWNDIARKPASVYFMFCYWDKNL